MTTVRVEYYDEESKWRVREVSVDIPVRFLASVETMKPFVGSHLSPAPKVIRSIVVLPPKEGAAL